MDLWLSTLSARLREPMTQQASNTFSLPARHSQGEPCRLLRVPEQESYAIDSAES